MFWGFGYFNNPFMMQGCFMPFMPNFFFNFGFKALALQSLFMPSFLALNRACYSIGTSIFQAKQSQETVVHTPARRKKHKSTPDISSSKQVAMAVQAEPVRTNPQKSTPAPEKSKSPARTATAAEPAQTDRKASLNTSESDFLKRTKEVAKKINCDYKDLLALMNSESGINSKAVNISSGATGLIQFTPQTAKDLGTTTDELKNMTPVEQLDYVEKYLVKYKKVAGFKANERLDAGDLYALIFLPGRAKRDVVTDSSEKYYAANAPALDLNKDGKITKIELSQRLTSHRVSDSIFLA